MGEISIWLSGTSIRLVHMYIVISIPIHAAVDQHHNIIALDLRSREEEQGQTLQLKNLANFILGYTCLSHMTLCTEDTYMNPDTRHKPDEWGPYN